MGPILMEASQVDEGEVAGSGGDAVDVDIEMANAAPPREDVSSTVLDPPTRSRSELPRTGHAVTVEEVPDLEEGGLPRKAWVEDFPGEAGTPIDTAKTSFERIRLAKEAAEDSPWAPFENEDEWQLSHWLVTSGLTQTNIEKFLKLKIVSRSCHIMNILLTCILQTRERTKPSFESNYMFFKKVDSLPSSEASWKVEVFDAVGDVVGEDGRLKKEKVELWQRNPVDCIRELMGNPVFRDSIRYAPERQYADAGGKNRIYGNMWTANWWWDLQVSFCDRQ